MKRGNRSARDSLQTLHALRQHLRQLPTSPQPVAPPPQTPPPTAEPDDSALFRQAAAGTRPLERPTAPLPRGLQPPRPEAFPLQHVLDEQAVLREAMSDVLDLDHLLETDAELSWRRAGVGADVLRKLRRGHWAIQSEIDLHGLRRDEAREALGQFLRTALLREWRCVRVIHGKGLSSPQREPVLKHKVRGWLMQRDEVMAYVQARPSDGGAGALVLLLRAARRAPRG